MANFFDNIVNAMGYVYHFIMSFIAPLNAPINNIYGYNITYYNPFFNYNVNTVKISDLGIFNDILNTVLDFLINAIDTVLNVFGLPFATDNMPFWALLLILTAITGVIIIVFRIVTNLFN